MKAALLALAFATTAFAAPVETWACKNGRNTVLTAVVSTEGTVATVVDTGIRLSLENTKGTTQELVGSDDIGHDYYEYRAFLVRVSESDFTDDRRGTARGQLVLITDAFVDCLGQAASAETFHCDVTIAGR